MLIGEYQHSIDSKGRYIVPAKFREELGSHFIITKGLDKCLFVYTMEGWQKTVESLRQLSTTDADARKFARNFFSGATEVETDKQGRVLIPINLRASAAIDKDIVTIGVANRLEIWSKELWQSYSQEAADEYEKVAAKLVGITF